MIHDAAHAQKVYLLFPKRKDWPERPYQQSSSVEMALFRLKKSGPKPFQNGKMIFILEKTLRYRLSWRAAFP
jgi:hypothetical protein